MAVPGASMVLMPAGDLRLCYGHAKSEVGNLLEDEVAEVWTRSRTCATRRHVQSEELGYMCWERVNSVNLDLLPWVRRFTPRT